MTTSPERSEGSEALSIDGAGKKVDANIHEGILDNPEADAKSAAGYPDLLRSIGLDSVAEGVEARRVMRKKLGGGTPMAGGGDAFFAHKSYGSLSKPGMINSHIPGRTDKIPMKVRGGSYIVPADVVSGIGEGNTLAGANALNKLFNTGPYGTQIKKMGTSNLGQQRTAKTIRQRFEEGGMAEPEMPAEPEQSDDGVDIIAAGGEYTVPPEVVRQIGQGDMKTGHDVLDQFVLQMRRKTIDDMRKLKGPKR